jgi:hypothetical protein
MNGEILKWLSNFLNDRTQRVAMGEFVSEWLKVLSGVPQGSVLATLFFIIYINDIPDLVENF